MEIQEIDINEIKPYKNNPREIPMESVQKVMNSIKEFGNNQPIVVDNDNVIVVGHTRWKALKQLGKTKAYIVKREFDNSVEVIGYVQDPTKNINDFRGREMLFPKRWVTLGVFQQTSQIPV